MAFSAGFGPIGTLLPLASTTPNRELTAALSMSQVEVELDLWNLVQQNLLYRVFLESPSYHPFQVSNVSFFLLRRDRLSSSESISSIAMAFVLTAAILRSLSRTLLSRRNFNQGTFANLCRTTLDRVPASVHDHATLILCVSHIDARCHE